MSTNKEVNDQDKDKELLEKETKKEIVLNNYLKKKLNLYHKYIKLTRETITKSFSDKNGSASNSFNSYVNEIQKDYDILKNEFDQKYPQYQSLYNECLSDITMGKPVLKQYRLEEFVLGFLEKEKDDLINELKKSIKSSKEFHLFREPKRDNLIDTKKGNKEIEKATIELQQNMLYELKKCNKFIYRIKKYNKLKEEIKKNTEILKKYIESEKSKNNEILSNISNNNNETSKIEEKNDKNNNLFPTFQMGKIDLKQSVNIGFLHPAFGKKTQNEKEKHDSGEDRRAGSNEKHKGKKTGLRQSLRKANPKKIKNKIISEFTKVEDLFNLSSEEGEKEKIIHDELHSDEDTVFEEKIKNPNDLRKKHLDEVKNEIPKINLDQIEYNKLKIMAEADQYSLQRRKYKSQNIDKNIKELKKIIEKMNEKVAVSQQKEKIMREYIEKIKDKYNVLKPIKTQSSVYNKKVDYIKKSIFRGENIKEEDDDGDDGEGVDGDLGSDYENEEKEESDKENKKEQKKEKEIENETKKLFKYKNDMKRSAFFGRVKNNAKDLKQSVVDGMFKNKLRFKKKKRERAKSK